MTIVSSGDIYITANDGIRYKVHNYNPVGQNKSWKHGKTFKGLCKK